MVEQCSFCAHVLDTLNLSTLFFFCLVMVTVSSWWQVTIMTDCHNKLWICHSKMIYQIKFVTSLAPAAPASPVSSRVKGMTGMPSSYIRHLWHSLLPGSTTRKGDGILPGSNYPFSHGIVLGLQLCFVTFLMYLLNFQCFVTFIYACSSRWFLFTLMLRTAL